MKGIEERVRGILCDIMEVGEHTRKVGLEEELSQTGINSITFIKVVVKIEEEFGIEFDDSALDYNKFKTLGLLISYIENKLKT